VKTPGWISLVDTDWSTTSCRPTITRTTRHLAAFGGRDRTHDGRLTDEERANPRQTPRVFQFDVPARYLKFSDTAALAAVAIIGRQLDQLVRLVDDLLDLTRITSGVIALTRAPVTLQAVVTACANAGISPKEVDGFASFSNDRSDASRLAAALGIKDLRHASMQWGGGGGGGSGAIANGAAAIATGQAECVVVFRRWHKVSSAASGKACAASAFRANSHTRFRMV
jgi:hypothetical protein